MRRDERVRSRSCHLQRSRSDGIDICPNEFGRHCRESLRSHTHIVRRAPPADQTSWLTAGDRAATAGTPGTDKPRSLRPAPDRAPAVGGGGLDVASSVSQIKPIKRC